MQNKNRNKIIPQMFDVKPVNATGDLDLERINRGSRILQFERPEKVAKSKTVLPQNFGQHFQDIKYGDDTVHNVILKPEEKKIPMIYRFGEAFPSESVPVIFQSEYQVPKIVAQEEIVPIMGKAVQTPKESIVFNSEYFAPQETVAPENPILHEEISLYPELENVQNVNVDFGQKFQMEKELSQNNFFEEVEEYKKYSGIAWSEIFALNNYKKFAFSFSSMATIIFFVIFGISFFNRGMKIKDDVLGTGKDAYVNLAMAKENIAGKDFEKSKFEFNEAYDKFSEISQNIDSLGKVLVESSCFVPFLSKLSSGAHIAQAGKDISRMGVLAGEIMQMTDGIKNPLDKNNSSVSFLKIFQDADNNLKEIQILIDDLQDNLDAVNVSDIPEAQRAQFVDLKGKLPDAKYFVTNFSDNSKIFTDVLGGNGPRKYLFLFQNNQEMRATGGFIGTYGLMDISNGNIKKFFIDGIFNPDGQLKAQVIPPAPIQKISAAWSLHDSNWFPDFPKSAEKAAWFYEKTGGPTVDGVITMTPMVMQKLLAVTGPIEMPDYGVTVDSENFIEQIQYEVEVDYDKELNEPKKILADLAPKILDRIFATKNFADMAKTMNVLMQSLNEKQILIYSKNYEIEKIISQMGWSGEVLSTQKDYLSVINTNINGYKTDGVVDETISHKAEIQQDGSVIDTVTVRRHHNGGSLAKEWWNKVNADYMRVYVPKGSTLISASGQTREFNSPPLDYKTLGFKHDAQIQTEEDLIVIDEDSGTRVYDDGDKTVFANWVYVSPQETVEVIYKYLLPFKIFTNSTDAAAADSYSLLAQKQSGSVGSQLISEISYPNNFKTIWNYPEDATQEGKSFKKETDLKSDKFIGAAFVKE
ncbi:MAG: hypothetical protein UT50_C0008G0006 [Candidatus Moranbacteria bacterium GW2011_GWA2_39_41]|nr:MAG: hypothetical protein UT50_C0008G0006 [Candidatus Moranbacteria bacterium GW2011_GWA2_39_41]